MEIRALPNGRGSARRSNPKVPDPLGRIAVGEPLVTILDPPSDQTSPGFRAMAEDSGLRSGIVVALKKDAVLVGTLAVYRREVRPFSENRSRCCKTFAAQAVIAMENARLITESARLWSIRPPPPRCYRSSTPHPAISPGFV